MDPDLRASLAAGALAGLVGLVAFTLLHVALVAPLWILLAIGLIPALLGGLLAGWAYRELDAARLPAPGPARGLAYGGLLWAALAPLEALALVRGPEPGANPLNAMQHVPPAVALPLLAGALAGWLLARTPRAAAALGLAALALAVPVSGTLVALGGSSLGPSIFTGMLLVELAAGLTLAMARPRLAARGKA